MTEIASSARPLAALRNSLGIALVCSHFAALILLILLTAMDRFTFPQFVTAAAVVTPLFAAYTTSIVRYFFAADTRSTEGAVDIPPVMSFLTWLISGLYIALVLVAIVWKAFGSLAFDDFIKMLALIETTFAVYTGIIVQRFFGASSVP